MKNTFKKTVGVMLASSIICAFMATGCTASESGEVKSTTPDTKLEQQAPSEAESDTKEIKLEQQTLIDEIKNPRDKTIIVLRYGLDGNEPATQQEVADLLGISRSYVSRIETRILSELRKRMESEYCL